MTAEDIVKAQLICYNAKDLDGFVNLHHEDVEAYMMETGELLFKGRDAMKVRYAKRFESPGLNATIKHRLILGNKVVDYECVAGIIENQIKELIVTYLIADEKIRKVWFMYP